jgi:hypothetical protein
MAARSVPSPWARCFLLCPDKLQREATNEAYSEFLLFCFSGNLQAYYRNLRWKGWEQEVSALTGTQGLACYPFLFTREGKSGQE